MKGRAPEPSLRDLAGWCWDARRWIVSGWCAGMALALLWGLAAVPQYRITMIVGPTTRTGTPDISALFPENASYALEYVLRSFGSGDSSDFMRFEAIARGPAVSSRLMAAEEFQAGWSLDRRWRWSRGDDFFHPERLSAYLNKRVRLEPVGHTPMRRLTYHHADPAFGRILLRALYDVTDGYIREEIKNKTAERIGWLRGAMQKTADPDHRRMLTGLLMEQEQVAMILALNEPYAAVIAEPPFVSAKPVWPDARMIFPALGLIGGFIGFMGYAASGRGRFALSGALQPA
ncbi:MAG: hypothetical protein HYS17_03155 [Micavibrio aeruginosavorus]|uniref:Polysaccharide chain length determinant N-terminal domain-containing protein n=1 Tax=Micavibrio aeruginosavorus TaxID=349221 RepID=A0A7T5R3D6_9BACT|nr:MAG: hypothetical protein HYS17_03155 [Micavibrio aeruginosavorus]